MLEGFVPIPNFEHYLINKQGEVYSTKYQRFLKPQFYPNGYCYFHLKKDKQAYNRMRHRLLMIVFKNMEDSVFNIVDHINGIKGDDRLENLRIVTPRENCEYAAKLNLTDKCKQVQIMNNITKEITNYPSATECARQLGIGCDTVRYRAHVGEEIVFPDNNRYRFYSEMPWKPVSLEKEKLLKRLRKIEIYTLDLFNEQPYTFKNIYKLCKFYKLSVESVISKLIHHPQIIIDDKVAIKYDKDSSWNLDNVYNSFYINNRPVTLYDVTTHRVQIFKTISEVAKLFNINRTCISVKCKTHGTKLYKGRWLFGFYPDLINYSGDGPIQE